MRARAIATMLGAGLVTAPASAGILTSSIDPTPFGNTAPGETRASIVSGAPIRAIYLTGTWQLVNGDPWSAEFRIRPVLDGNFMLGPTAGRAFGGLTGAGPGIQPFVHNHPGTTWNNTTVPNSFLYGGLGGAASYATGGTYEFNFRQTFGATNTAQIVDGTLYALTDAVLPQIGNLSGAPAMTNRPTSLTTISGAGSYKYQTFTFAPKVDGVFAIMADWRVPGQPGSGTSGTDWFDGHLNVYQGGFDPTSVLTNLIGVSDDAVGAHATSALRGSGMLLQLMAGHEYTIVATHFSGTLSPTTDFTLYIAGAVPAPGALALFGLAGLVGARRRRAN